MSLGVRIAFDIESMICTISASGLRLRAVEVGAARVVPLGACDRSWIPCCMTKAIIFMCVLDAMKSTRVFAMYYGETRH